MTEFHHTVPLALLLVLSPSSLFSFNCKLGSFCSRAGVCGLSWDFTALLSSLRFNVKYFMGSGRQFCKPAWASAHGRWTGFRNWVQIHRSWLCGHLPTTVSLTKFTFSTSLFVKRKLLSVWAPVWARESQGVCRWRGNPQPGWLVGAEEGGQNLVGAGGLLSALSDSVSANKGSRMKQFSCWNWLHIVCAEFVFLQGSHLKVSEGLFHVTSFSPCNIYYNCCSFMHFYLSAVSLSTIFCLY